MRDVDADANCAWIGLDEKPTTAKKERRRRTQLYRSTKKWENEANRKRKRTSK